MSWQALPPHIRNVALEVLTEKQLRVFQDRLNGHSWRKIAIANHLNEATCRGHYRRALDRLAPYYEGKAA